MFTKNWYTYLGVKELGGLTSTNMSFRLTDGQYYNLSSLSETKLSNLLANIRYGENYSTSDNGIFFGKGKAQPSIDDYTLTEVITSNECSISIAKQEVIVHGQLEDEQTVNTPTSITYVCTYNITNKTDAPITISEIGITTYGRKTSNSNYFLLLLERSTILSEDENGNSQVGITIPGNNGVGQVDYSVTIVIPQNAEEI